MEFPVCEVKSVKVNIAAGEIRISFSLALCRVNLDTAEELARYVDRDDGDVELRIIPKQINFLKAAKP